MGVMGAEEVEGGGAILDCNLVVGVEGPCRGGKRGGRREGASKNFFKVGRKFSGKSYALCRVL